MSLDVYPMGHGFEPPIEHISPYDKLALTLTNALALAVDVACASWFGIHFGFFLYFPRGVEG
jgi:hypothetical protein